MSNEIHVSALKNATPAQLMKIRSLIARANQSSVGYLIFYSEEALKALDSRRFSDPSITRAIEAVGEETIADILIK